MALPSNLDATFDGSLWITGTHVVGSATTGNSGASASFDLQDSPVDFTVFFEVASVSVAANDAAIVVIQGSTTADFSAGNYLLGVMAWGDTAALSSQLGATVSSDRGTGSYAVRCHNVAYDSNGNPVNCRYVRTQVKTIGATSGITYAARVALSR